LRKDESNKTGCNSHTFGDAQIVFFIVENKEVAVDE